jgi:hypothetical protein
MTEFGTRPLEARPPLGSRPIVRSGRVHKVRPIASGTRVGASSHAEVSIYTRS